MVHQLPHEFSNDLRLGILGNYLIFKTSQILVEIKPSAYSTFLNKNLAIAVKNHPKVETRLFLPCLTLLDVSISFQVFCWVLQCHFTCGEPKLC